MLLEKLPLELLHQTIGLVLCDDDSGDLTALLGVNSALERETTAVYLRRFGNTTEDTRWKQMPLCLRRRMARDTTLSEPDPGNKPDIKTYMHAVVDYLKQYSNAFDPEKSGLLSQKQWLYEVCDVLAPYGADCKCGKPAFLHLKCYDLAYVRDTAFHVAILKRHAALEMAMIDDGRSWNSVCPYLKVSKRNPMFTRRNALEWACAYGLEGTARRLVWAAEEKGVKPEEYIPTAAAIVAVVHGSGNHQSLLGFLLERLVNPSYRIMAWESCFRYQNRIMPAKEWLRRVLTTLTMYNKTGAIAVMRRYFPYLGLSNTLSLLPPEFGEDTFGVELLQKERPFCTTCEISYGEGLEWERNWHWFKCNSQVCHRKIFPLCEKCRLRHATGPDREWYDDKGYPSSRLYYS